MTSKRPNAPLRAPARQDRPEQAVAKGTAPLIPQGFRGICTARRLSAPLPFAASNFMRAASSFFTLGESVPWDEVHDRNQHVLEFQVAVVALNALFNEGPCALGATFRRGAQLAEKPHGRQAGRAALLVEQRRFRFQNGLVARAGIEINQPREHVQAFPARLRLGTIERIDQRAPIGNHDLGAFLGHYRQNARRILRSRRDPPESASINASSFLSSRSASSAAFVTSWLLSLTTQSSPCGAKKHPPWARRPTLPRTSSAVLSAMGA